MWYVIQARLHGADEDDLHVVAAETLATACADVEAEIRDTCNAPLCAACAGAECTNDAAEVCGACRPVYIINTLECETRPREISIGGHP